MGEDDRGYRHTPGDSRHEMPRPEGVKGEDTYLRPLQFHDQAMVDRNESPSWFCQCPVARLSLTGSVSCLGSFGIPLTDQVALVHVFCRLEDRWLSASADVRSQNPPASVEKNSDPPQSIALMSSFPSSSDKCCCDLKKTKSLGCSFIRSIATCLISVFHSSCHENVRRSLGNGSVADHGRAGT